jgi:hypothetical protein
MRWTVVKMPQPWACCSLSHFQLGVDRAVPMVGPRRLAGLEARLIVVAGGEQELVVIGVEEVEKPPGHVPIDGERFAHCDPSRASSIVPAAKGAGHGNAD